MLASNNFVYNSGSDRSNSSMSRNCPNIVQHLSRSQLQSTRDQMMTGSYGLNQFGSELASSAKQAAPMILSGYTAFNGKGMLDLANVAASTDDLLPDHYSVMQEPCDVPKISKRKRRLNRSKSETNSEKSHRKHKKSHRKKHHHKKHHHDHSGKTHQRREEALSNGGARKRSKSARKH